MSDVRGDLRKKIDGLVRDGHMLLEERDQILAALAGDLLGQAERAEGEECVSIARGNGMNCREYWVDRPNRWCEACTAPASPQAAEVLRKPICELESYLGMKLGATYRLVADPECATCLDHAKHWEMA